MTKEQLEALRRWLLTFPGWGSLETDELSLAPRAGALVPCGMKELSRFTNVLGQTRALNRYHFVLVAAKADTDEENALWLLSLQQWVAVQSAQGHAPQFGENQTIRAINGQRKRPDRSGRPVYTVDLYVDFLAKLCG